MFLGGKRDFEESKNDIFDKPPENNVLSVSSSPVIYAHV
jgi:hypothetical protein